MPTDKKFAYPSPNFSTNFSPNFPNFEPRFRNWLRWCAEYASEPHGSAASAEGAYRSPQIWDEVRPNLGLLNPVDKWDAMVVQRAYVGMPDGERRVIKFMYFRPHWRREWIAQKLDVHHSRLGERLLVAKGCMSLVLDGLDGKEYISRTVSRQKPLMEAF